MTRAVQAFAGLDHVDSVIPEITLNFYAITSRYAAPYLTVRAIPADLLDKLASVDEGRGLRSDTTAPELVMGLGAARNFYEGDMGYVRDYEGPDLDWLETTLELYLGGQHYQESADIPSSRRYKAAITGILADTEEDYHNDEVYMSLEAAKAIIGENYKLADAMNVDADTYDRVLILADEMDNVTEILGSVRDYGFEAYSSTEWIEELQDQQRSQQGQLAAIGLISLIVSAIGIANTMMTGILERKREIGVMKVIGVSIRSIRTLFLMESAFIGMTGGLLGVVLSHIFGYLLVSGGGEMNLLGLYFSAGTRLQMPLWLDAGAVAVAVLVGMAAGIFPARRATAMSPLEAIRG